MRFELHCHSYYSRGTKIPWECLYSPAEVVRHAKKAGLGGLALTDHRVTEGLKEAGREARKQGLVFIPGQEIHTEAGHLLALGINSRIRNGMQLEESLEAIHSQGGIAVAPHPFDIKKDGIGNEIDKVDAVEVFNSINLDQFSNRLARIKARRLGKPEVVGSDAHSLDMLGLSVNIIEASDMDGALKAIRKGHVQHEKRYVPLKTVLSWVCDRFAMSYQDILAYINHNYSYPKAGIARFFLDSYMSSKRSEIWKILAQIGVSSSKIYGAMNFVARY